MKKPQSLKWLKGEWNEPWYALHIIGDVVIVLLILRYFSEFTAPLNIQGVLILSAMFFVADVAMHTIFQKD